MANQSKTDRNQGQHGGRQQDRIDEVGSERNRESIDEVEDRSRKQREGNLGNERNRGSENMRNRGEEGNRGRSDTDRMPE
jgi:hypothetical protein